MRLRGKICSRRVILGAALGLTLALRTYAWACSPAVSPVVLPEQFDLSVLSVSVDGVVQPNLYPYEQHQYRLSLAASSDEDATLEWSDSSFHFSTKEYYVLAN